jgi:hypothetical protein
VLAGCIRTKSGARNDKWDLFSPSPPVLKVRFLEQSK